MRLAPNYEPLRQAYGPEKVLAAMQTLESLRFVLPEGPVRNSLTDIHSQMTLIKALATIEANPETPLTFETKHQ